jgi:hypothetical protein
MRVQSLVVALLALLASAEGAVAVAGLPSYQIRCDHPSHGARHWFQGVSPDGNACALIAAHRERFRNHHPYLVECACMMEGDDCQRVELSCPK